MKNVFFESAKKSLLKAENILSNRENEDLHYAALELRLCIESIVYSRLQKLASDKVIDISAYMSWQPNKILEYFLALDPYSLTQVTISIAKGSKETVPDKWTELGCEYKIDKKFINNNYHKLGSYLHQKTMKNVCKDYDHDKTRISLTIILNNIKKVIESNIRNVITSASGKFKCIQCYNDITVLIPSNTKDNIVSQTIICPHFKTDNKNCGAEYRLVTKKDGVTSFQPLTEVLKCTHEECDGDITFWKKEITPYSKKSCPKCGVIYGFRLAISKEID